MKLKYPILIVFILAIILSFIYVLTSYQTKPNNMTNNLSLQQSINTIASLEGKAANAKAGAVLLLSDNPVYIEGLDYWPQNFIDKQIVLSGKLTLKKYIPKAETDENGLTSQGGSGDNDYVLERASVEIDKGDFGYKRLTDTGGFPQGQQEAIKAIIVELENKKENPKEFFAKFEPDPTASKLSFLLAHQNSFKVENLSVKGNPSGKDGMAIYDLVQKKVNFWLYQ